MGGSMSSDYISPIYVKGWTSSYGLLLQGFDPSKCLDFFSPVDESEVHSVSVQKYFGLRLIYEAFNCKMEDPTQNFAR